MTVTCAIIRRQGLLLAAQRQDDQAQAGLWEFPGGKVEPGESLEECLHREIWEELACRVEIERALMPLEHTYKEKNLQLELCPFWCEWVSGEPQLLDHQALRWMRVEDLGQLNWSAADRALLVREQLLC